MEYCNLHPLKHIHPLPPPVTALSVPGIAQGAARLLSGKVKLKILSNELNHIETS